MKTENNCRYIYLAGKIKIDHNATEYRAKIAPFLRKCGLYSLDPLRGKYAMKIWNVLAPNEVVVRDLQDIDRSNVVLAVMMKCDDASFGTPCEIMYAWSKHVPVILITNERYLVDHFWPQSLCSNIFFVDEENGQTFDEVLMQAAEHIAHWYGNDLEKEIYNSPQLLQKGQQNLPTYPYGRGYIGTTDSGKQEECGCTNCNDRRKVDVCAKQRLDCTCTGIRESDGYTCSNNNETEQKRNCDDALDESCSQCHPLGEGNNVNPNEEGANINPNEEAARADHCLECPHCHDDIRFCNCRLMEQEINPSNAPSVEKAARAEKSNEGTARKKGVLEEHECPRCHDDCRFCSCGPNPDGDY